jgi:DNA-binding transcriptional LysR family regulator
MELSALRAFVEVAERASFSEAANALFLTQPAVSKRVAQLEGELGARLFDRIGRQVSLTSTGSALLPRARRLLNDARDLTQYVDQLAGEVRGRLVMGTSHHIGLHRLPGPLKQFRASHPAVELDIRFMDSEAACRAVESGDLELAIVTLPPDEHERLDLAAIWEDPLVVMAAEDHPICALRQPSLESLAEHPAVLPGPTTYTREILESAMRDRGVNLHIAMETNYLETLRMLVATGLGWSLLPATLLDTGVQAVDIEGLRLSRSLGAVTHRRRDLSNAARQMVEICRSSAANRT